MINKSVRVYGGWDGVTGGDPGIPDPETYVSILDGQNARQGVTIMLGLDEIVTFSGFTVRNGNATGKVAICSAPNAAGCGGGIMVVGGTATIEHCILEDNVASTTTDAMYKTGYGGGIYIQNPVDVTIRDNLIHSNDASTAASGPVGNNGEGGGIYVRGADADEDLTITENEISENNAAAVSYVGWGVGLSIFNSHGTISQNDIHDNNPNHSAFGSGIYSGYSDLSIRDNRFINNQGGSSLSGGF